MSKELITFLIVCAIALPLIIIVIIRHIHMKKDTDAIRIGMSILDVKNILGEPNSTHTADNIMTCSWNIHGFPRVGKIYKRIIVFKDGNVISITNP